MLRRSMLCCLLVLQACVALGFGDPPKKHTTKHSTPRGPLVSAPHESPELGGGVGTSTCDPLTPGSAASAPPETTPSNILLIVMDDVGPEMIGAYHIPNEAPPTPTIDGLAAQGVRFNRAWADPWCSPTRATIMTGRHARRYGIGRAIEPFHERTVLPQSEVSLPQWIGDHAPWSLTRALFGKWHLTAAIAGPGAPLDYGFQRFSGTMANLDATDAFDRKSMSYTSWEAIDDDVITRRKGYATSAVVDDALAWTKAQSGPWFAWVAFHAAHTPWHTPPQALHTYGTIPKKTIPTRERAMIQAMDTEIGRLLDGLGADVRAHTNVIVLGDNGTTGGVGLEQFRHVSGKSTLNEHGVRVPLIVSGPAVRTPGRAVDALVQTSDLFLTISELAGVDGLAIDWPIDSVSLLPYLRDPAQGPRRAWVYAEVFTPNNDDARKPKDERAARDDRYKLVRSKGVDTLYDMGASWVDPKPIVAHDQLGRDRQAALTKVLDACGGASLAPPATAPPAAPKVSGG